jgi:hypothetical protein
MPVRVTDCQRMPGSANSGTAAQISVGDNIKASDVARQRYVRCLAVPK